MQYNTFMTHKLNRRAYSTNETCCWNKSVLARFIPQRSNPSPNGIVNWISQNKPITEQLLHFRSQLSYRPENPDVLYSARPLDFQTPF